MVSKSPHGLRVNGLITLLALFLCSCSTFLPQSKDVFNVDTAYRRDMLLTIDGKVYEGMAVVQEKAVGPFLVTADIREAADLFTLSSCAKFLQKESAWDVTTKLEMGIWERKIIDKKKVSFQYSRSNLEREQPFCYVYLQGLTKEKGKHSEAVIDVIDSRNTLPGWINCGIDNGQKIGAFACQLPLDMFYKVVFDVDVEMIQDCDKPDLKGNRPVYGPKKAWSFNAKKGDCRHYFYDKNNQQFRFWMYGFEQSPIRN